MTPSDLSAVTEHLLVVPGLILVSLAGAALLMLGIALLRARQRMQTEAETAAKLMGVILIYLLLRHMQKSINDLLAQITACGFRREEFSSDLTSRCSGTRARSAMETPSNRDRAGLAILRVCAPCVM